MARIGGHLFGRAAAAAAIALVPLLAGCGSSGGSSRTSSTPSTGSTGSSLKVSTTPRYASPSPSSPVRSGVVDVAYRNITIRPDTVRVHVGATIRWTNYDAVEHNVTSTGGAQHFASGDFSEGQTFEIHALRPGIIHYLCTIHPTTMNGTIEVVR